MAHAHDPSGPRAHPRAQEHLRRRGVDLRDPAAHRDHHAASRRGFLRTAGLTALGTAFGLGGGQRAFAMQDGPLMRALNDSDCGDRVLVLVRLKGGNDGLNTVIPHTNDTYFNIRPTLAYGPGERWNLDGDFAMPNELQPLRAMWQADQMRIVHNVGYPEANYSHFRSSDIWASASDSDTVERTGWLGRLLEYQYEGYAEAPPVVPPALQIGVQANLLFQGRQGNLALALSSPSEFYQVATTGQLYELGAPAGPGPSGDELRYVRSIANSAFRYAGTIREHYLAGRNEVDYADDTLSEQLGIVSRLIKGGLGTKLYLVSIDGFDTHADQAAGHPDLLRAVGDGVSTFFEDLRAAGHSERVLAMTFSEFGRTIFENGSAGTDHGTSAPVLVFGDEVGQGYVGDPIDIDTVDQYGDPYFETDFRGLYASVLEDWLCVDPEVIDKTLGAAHARVPGVFPGGTEAAPWRGEVGLLGYQRDPNHPRIYAVKYASAEGGPLRLTLQTPQGRVVRTLVDGSVPAGSYTYTLAGDALGLRAGAYVLELAVGGRRYRRVFGYGE